MPLRGVPVFVKQVHDVLHVVVEVGAVEGHAETDAALSSIVHRGKEGIVAPAPGPVHLEVLEREQGFALCGVEHAHQAKDAVVGTGQHVAARRPSHRLNFGAAEGLRRIEGPAGGCTGARRPNVDACGVTVHRQQFAERGGKLRAVDQQTPVPVAGFPGLRGAR